LITKEKKMETKVDVVLNKSLRLDRSEALPLKPNLTEGKHVVIVLTRIWPDREKTFDTGMVEELYLELIKWPDAGRECNSREILDKAVYTFGNVARLYESVSFRGKIALFHNDISQRLAGFTDMEFTSPVLDRHRFGSMPVRIEFDSEHDETTCWGEPKWCKFCGNSLRPFARFCARCGKKVAANK
jgi:hypothetical protein